MEAIIIVLAIAAGIYFLLKEEGKKAEIRFKEAESNIKADISSLKSKYDKDLWDILSSHHESIGTLAQYALGELRDIISLHKDKSLEYQYQLLTTNYIQRGNRLDRTDFLQKFTKPQIQKLISYSKGDFPLYLVCKLYLSVPQYRELIDEDIMNMNLFLDLVYSKAVYFKEKRILFLEPNERYQLGLYFLASWKEW
jgi:hypothetical protein